MKTPGEHASELVANPYAFPGGYPQYAVTDDGGALCKKCCADEHDSIAESNPGDGWHVEALDINYEDAGLYCDHCSELIEAAYSE